MNESIAQHFLSLRDLLCHDKLSPQHCSIISDDVKLLASASAVKTDAGYHFHDGSKLVCGPDGWEATPMSVEFQRESLLPLADELRQFADGQEDYIADLCLRAADGLESRLTLLLEDPMSDDDDPPANVCRISADRNGIYIRPQGYGDCESADGEGCPVIVEFYNRQMRVIVWDDINSSNPNIISLEGAREDVREEDDNQDQTEDRGDDNG